MVGVRLKTGDRVCLESMPNDPDPVPVGTLGTVESVADHNLGGTRSFTQVHVKWDNGRSLSCVMPPDRLTVIKSAD